MAATHDLAMVEDSLGPMTIGHESPSKMEFLFTCRQSSYLDAWY